MVFVGRQNVNGHSDVWWGKQFDGQQEHHLEAS
jgi:hypothetical protein